MALVNKTIKIDLWQKMRERITVVQREILGRSLTFQLCSGALPVNLTGCSVTFYAEKPDGSIVFNSCTIVTAASGICSYTFSEQTIVAAGDLTCQLVIIDSSANELRTQEFTIEVQASSDYTTSVESTSEYSTLQGMIGDINTHETRLDTAESDIDTLSAGTLGKVTTAGDILYATAAGVLARLALGTAGKYLVVNAGATAPEWVLPYKIGHIDRALSADAGNVATTGLGFKPSALIFFGVISGTLVWSMMIRTTAARGSMYSTGTAMESGSAKLLTFTSSSGNLQTADVYTFDTDGFTLAWTKTGSPTGDVDLEYLAFR